MRIARLVVAVWFFGICGVTQAGKIYWAEFDTKTIWRANLDGSGIETIVTTAGGGPYNVAVDPVRGKVYWTTTEDVSGTDYDSLWRANLTGNQVELIAQEIGSSASDVAIDAGNGRIYWAKGRTVGDIQLAAPDILVADVDQGLFSVLHSVRCTPSGVVVGAVSGSIYWSDLGYCGFNSEWPPLLRRGSSDGLTAEDVLTGPSADITYPTGIAVNELTGDLYWTDSFLDAVVRGSLDGSTPPVTIASANTPVDIAVDLDTGAVFWSDADTGMITRSDVDGSNAHVIINVGQIGLGGIALLTRALPVPAASTWGLVIAALTLLAAGTVVIGMRRCVMR